MEYSPGGDSIYFVYCKGLPQALEFLRYVEPLLRLSWRSSTQVDEWQDRLKKEHGYDLSARLPKEQRQKHRAEIEDRRRREFEETRQAWEKCLAAAQSTVTAAA